MSKAWKKYYTAVRRLLPDRYNEAIATATIIGANHRLTTAAMADIEHALMMTIVKCLNVSPDNLPEGSEVRRVTEGPAPR